MGYIASGGEEYIKQLHNLYFFTTYIFTRFHRPDLLPEGKTQRISGK